MVCVCVYVCVVCSFLYSPRHTESHTTLLTCVCVLVCETFLSFDNTPPPQCERFVPRPDRSGEPHTNTFYSQLTYYIFWRRDRAWWNCSAFLSHSIFVFRQKNYYSTSDWCVCLCVCGHNREKKKGKVSEWPSVSVSFSSLNAHILYSGPRLKIMEPLLLSKIDRIFNSLRPQNHPNLHHST